MFAYAARRLASRPHLWVAAGALAVLAAVPPLLLATVLARPAAALLLSGDPGLAFELMPGPLGRGVPAAWLGAGAAGAAGLLVWARLYAPAVLLSDDDGAGRLRAAWAGSRRTWRAVAVLYVAYAALLAAAAAALAAGVVLTPGGAAGGIAFGALGLWLAARTVVRVWLTVAIRSAVLDGCGPRAAVRAGAATLSARRQDAVTAWIGLAAAGVAVWIGGRLLSPVLQDTALDYPGGSVYAWSREAVQAALAIPLEAVLIALALATWTGFHRGEQAPGRTPAAARPRSGDNPALVRALAALAALTLVANGGATLVDEAWARSERARLDRIGRREITPESAVRSATETAAGAPAYKVEADLDGRRLEWSTTITYRNDWGEPLDSLPLHVYPAAYSRPAGDIPLAPDLAAADPLGRIRAAIDPGSVVIEEVTAGGRPAPHELVGTVLRIGLRRPPDPGETVTVRVGLRARLPVFPERFGVWEDLTLLGNWIPTVAHRDRGLWRLYSFGDVGDPFLSDIAAYDVTITAPESDVVVGSGTLAAVESAAPGRRSWRFVSPASRDAAFAVAPALRGLQRSAGGAEVRVWYSPDQRRIGARDLDAAVSAVRYFTDVLGPAEQDEIEVVLTRGFLGGMEYPGLVFVAGGFEQIGGLPALAAIADYTGFEDSLRRAVVGHEIAHQWWYASVGNDPVREPWLDEALSETVVRMWLRAADGSERAWMMSNLRSRVDAPRGVLGHSVHDFASNDDYVETIYLSGSEALMEVRRRLGPQLFESVLRAHYRSARGRVATADDFVAAARAVAGQRAVDLLARYL